MLDVQQEMLDHTMRVATERGVAGIVPALADARRLPYDEDAFDGAYLVTVLGEIPDQEAALRELEAGPEAGGPPGGRRALRDLHMVTHSALARRAAAAGLRVERRLGDASGHYTRLAPA